MPHHCPRRFLAAPFLMLLVVALTLACASAGSTQGKDSGRPAPEFAGLTGWLNSGPLTMAGLREANRVVLVDFWTANCTNCRNTRPYVRAWHEKYADHGLTVVGIHTPEFEYEHDAATVRKTVESERIHFPVAQDNEYATWKAFQTRAWPTKYLVGADGNVQYVHIGEGDYAGAERAIRAALTAAGYDLSAIPEGGSSAAAFSASPSRLASGLLERLLSAGLAP